MDVLEAIEKRKSIRKYKSMSIPKEHLKKILEAGRLAPSASNRQPWQFIIIRSPEQKKLLAEAVESGKFLVEADVVVIALANTEVSPKWSKLDVMISMEHLVLASTSLGYGTCWIGRFQEEQIKLLHKIPKTLEIVALLTIGMPNERPDPKPRKDLAEIFFSEEYGKPLTLI